MKNIIGTFLLSVAILAIGGCKSSSESSVGSSIDNRTTRVLVDGIHQREGLPDLTWKEDQFKYTYSATTRGLLNTLKKCKVEYTLIAEGELTKDLLKPYDILFMNVPLSPETAKQKRLKRDVPLIRPGEVKAIHYFVNNGGGLFVVGEHNNAYDNMEVLRPLLEPWKIELVDAFAAESRRGRYAINPSGYRTLTRKFKKHFVTDGIKIISAAGGAPFSPESKGGIAFLSKEGFIDRGNFITKKPSKYSNHRWDKGEYKGPNIPVAIAQEIGKGRVVVVGDHNMIGAHWIGFGDNYDFALNAFQWLAHRENEPLFRNTKPDGLVFGMEQDRVNWQIGRKSRDDYYYFFLSMTQSPKIYPVGFSGFDKEVDVLGFLEPNVLYSQSELKAIDKTLEKGKRIFLLFDASDIKKGSVQLLKRYAPNLVIAGTTDKTIVKNLLPGLNKNISHLEGNYRKIGSKLINFNGGSVAALKYSKDGFANIGGGVIAPKSHDKGTPYLLDVQLEGGEPLAWAILPDGKKTTLLQRIAVKNGELILMVQGKIWSGYTLPFGVEKPKKASMPAYKSIMRFMQWLAAEPTITKARI